MRKFIALFLCIVLSFLFTACGNDDNPPQSGIDEKSSHSSVSDEQTDKEKDLMVNSANKRSARVIKSFYAVEGAVIYDQTYDEYGYPDCCFFHKKCESCGNVSNNNGSARGNITTSYYCPKCKISNRVEIKADSEFIEVNE